MMIARLLASAAFLLGTAIAAGPAQADGVRLEFEPEAPAAVVPAYVAPQYRCTTDFRTGKRYCYRAFLQQSPYTP